MSISYEGPYIIVNGKKFLKSKVTVEKIEWLKENYNNLKMTELSIQFGLNQESLYQLIKKLGLKRRRFWKAKLPYRDNDFIKILEDQSISNSEIAYKYGVTTDAVRYARQRRGLNGYHFRGRTTLEVKICEVLDRLDLAYKEQLRIDKWLVDFYLGNKTIIEVDGEQHKDKKVMEKDKRKDKWFFDNGYFLIHIPEQEIDNSEKIIKELLGGRFNWIINQL